MELSEAVRRRRMVRSYDPSREVDGACLDRLLREALRAPSAGFAQGRELLVLRRAQERELFWRLTAEHGAPPPRAGAGDGGGRWLAGMRTAPVLVVVLSSPATYLERYAEPDKGWTDRDPGRWPVPYWDVDAGMAAHQLLLSAVDAGLGACFFGVPSGAHAAVRESFGVPAERRLVGVVSLGHPAPDRRSPSLRRGRRPAAEVVHDGRYGGGWPAG
ncbi:nitroreductase [Kineococcus xinjiangensis]|uniref:Nitroreductase n=1 Tax=Kineococcus xinjiangensis TaxID=512762 RepID=A0A2S6IVT1_9ACTN|nr:nitroreductase family protein [Kineococcus xinjiangensis]PPK98386.1 nitroreductase [Kineococcus xinjiangensis]